MNCTDCQQRDACDLAGKDDPLLTGCDASHGTWAFDRLRLDRMTADRDALRDEVEALRHEVELTNEHEHQILTERNEARAELDLVRGAIRADDERLYAAWVRIHGAPDDCANIGCDAPEWMADEILRLRAVLDRTKEELERVRRNHLRRMAHTAWLRRDYPRSTPISFCRRGQYDRFALACSRAALERKGGA